MKYIFSFNILYNNFVIRTFISLIIYKYTYIHTYTLRICVTISFKKPQKNRAVKFLPEPQCKISRTLSNDRLIDGWNKC